MQQPKISIIMTIYNDAAYLAEAINSVTSQTYTNWELIIINDASTDDTESIIQNFEKKDNRIHYICNTKNKGQTSSLNYGIRIATGEFIARIDSDDIWKDTHKLQEQVAFLVGHPEYGMVGCWAYTIDTKGNRLSDLSYPIHDK